MTTVNEEPSTQVKEKQHSQSDPEGYYAELHEWKGLKLRMGINTGLCRINYDSEKRKYDYNGPTVYTTSRIAHMANAGQILVSEYTLNCLEFTGRLVYEFIKLGSMNFAELREKLYIYQLSFMYGLLYPKVRQVVEEPPEGIKRDPNVDYRYEFSEYDGEESTSSSTTNEHDDDSAEDGADATRDNKQRKDKYTTGEYGVDLDSVWANGTANTEVTLRDKVKSFFTISKASPNENKRVKEKPVVQTIESDNNDILQRFRCHADFFPGSDKLEVRVRDTLKFYLSPFNEKEQRHMLERACEAFCIPTPQRNDFTSDEAYNRMLKETIFRKIGELAKYKKSTRQYKKNYGIDYFEEYNKHSVDSSDDSSDDSDDDVMDSNDLNKMLKTIKDNMYTITTKSNKVFEGNRDALEWGLPEGPLYPVRPRNPFARVPPEERSSKYSPLHFEDIDTSDIMANNNNNNNIINSDSINDSINNIYDNVNVNVNVVHNDVNNNNGVVANAEESSLETSNYSEREAVNIHLEKSMFTVSNCVLHGLKENRHDVNAVTTANDATNYNDKINDDVHESKEEEEVNIKTTKEEVEILEKVDDKSYKDRCIVDGVVESSESDSSADEGEDKYSCHAQGNVMINNFMCSKSNDKDKKNDIDENVYTNKHEKQARTVAESNNNNNNNDADKKEKVEREVKHHDESEDEKIHKTHVGVDDDDMMTNTDNAKVDMLIIEDVTDDNTTIVNNMATTTVNVSNVDSNKDVVESNETKDNTLIKQKDVVSVSVQTEKMHKYTQRKTNTPIEVDKSLIPHPPPMTLEQLLNLIRRYWLQHPNNKEQHIQLKEHQNIELHYQQLQQQQQSPLEQETPVADEDVMSESDVDSQDQEPMTTLQKEEAETPSEDPVFYNGKPTMNGNLIKSVIIPRVEQLFRIVNEETEE